MKWTPFEINTWLGFRQKLSLTRGFTSDFNTLIFQTSKHSRFNSFLISQLHENPLVKIPSLHVQLQHDCG